MYIPYHNEPLYFFVDFWHFSRFLDLFFSSTIYAGFGENCAAFIQPLFTD